MSKVISFRVSEQTYKAIHDLKNSRGHTLKEFMLFSIIKWIKAQKKLSPALSNYYDKKMKIIQRELQMINERRYY